MPKRDGGNSKIYQIKVTLRYIEPPIWRRFHIARDASLWELHEVLQRVMGWGHDHLYQFLIKGKHYGEPFEDLDFEDAIETQLSQVVSRAGSKFVYEYDFGDGWEHELHVESTIPDKPGTAQPACIDGQRSCPPEDCGGVWGYYRLLEALQDPEHEEHEAMRDWMEGGFDPEAFDVADVNRRLRASMSIGSAG